MKTKWKTKVWLVCMVAVMALCGIQQVLAFEAIIDPITAYRHWQPKKVQHIYELALSEFGLRADGEWAVKNNRIMVIGFIPGVQAREQALGDTYYIRNTEGNEEVLVKCVNERPLPNDFVYLLATVQEDPSLVDPLTNQKGVFLQEAYRWRFPPPAEVIIPHTSSRELREWLNFDYYYALENAFRLFVVRRMHDGISLDILQRNVWQSRRVESSGLKTTLKEIEDHIAIQPPPISKAGGEEEKTVLPPPPPGLDVQKWVIIGLAGVVGLLLIVLLVALIAKSSGTTVKSASQLPPTPDILPQSTYTPPPATNVAPKAAAVTTVLEGKPVDPKSTQVLSGYGLNVLSGGKAKGDTLLLSSTTLLGRDPMDYMGYFLQLNMYDRPEKETFCSRHYVKITQRDNDEDVFDVEVMNESRNPVTIDGKTIRGKGETVMAKVGSHIKLMPDWEFEIIKC